VERGAIGIGVDRNRANAHLAKRTDDAQRNFAAIGYQNLLEHVLFDCNGMCGINSERRLFRT